MSGTADIGGLLPAIAEEVRPLADEGAQADYIPSLADEDPYRFALATDLTGSRRARGTLTSPSPSRASPRCSA